MRKENLFRNKATKGLVAALAVAMATTVAPVNADAAAAKKVTIAKGDTVKKAGKKGSFKSNKTKVAKVNKNGKITAVKAGTAKITAKTKKGKKVTYKVTVKKAPTISKKKVTVTAGNSKKVTVNKNGAKYLKVSFKSNNKSVATVNKNGKITGVAAGTATVTATVKGNTKNYKLKVAVTVNAAPDNTPDDPTPPDDNTTPDNPDVTDKNPVITQATNLAAGEYDTVTIKSSTPAEAMVTLGTAKIGTLYVESGAEYNVDASQAEIGTVEIVGSGQATAKAQRVAKAPRINFGNNAKASGMKVNVKADVYFAGTAKLGSVEVASTVNVYLEVQVGTLTIATKGAAVSAHGAVDELIITGEEAKVGIFAAVSTVKVEGKKASIVVAASIKVATMTIAAEGAQVAGNGTVEDLKINAAGAVVQTAVTKAVVDASVTDGAMIGGVKRAVGTESTNISAVANQKDTDPVNLVTDDANQGGNTNTPGTVTPGGNGGSGTTTPTTSDKTVNAFVNKKTNHITLYANGQTIVITKENLKKWVKKDQSPIYVAGTENKVIDTNYGKEGLDYITATLDGVTVHIPTTSITGETGTANNSIVNVNAKATATVGMYKYDVEVRGINHPGDDDAAVITVKGYGIPTSATFQLTPDNWTASKNTVIRSTNTVGKVTYKNDEITVYASDVRAAYKGGGSVAAELPITVKDKNGNTVRKTAKLTEAVKGISQHIFISCLCLF